MMRKSFRKIPLLLAVCGLAFALTGCGGSGSPAGTPTFTVTFDSAGGSPVASQRVSEGGRVTAPAVPRWAEMPTTAGLWSEPDFVWRQENDTVWDFQTPVTRNITLTGTWGDTELSLIAEIAANDVVAAVTHANTHPGAFILAIDDDVTSGQNLMRTGNTKLTIIGIGQPREIRFTTTSNSQRLFDVGPASGTDTTISLTLGNNITLVGRDGNTNALVRVWNGARLYMYDSSRITGHTNTREGGVDGSGAAVQVRYNGTFTMRGGIITGNRSTHTGPGTSLVGGVNVHNTGIFNMEGGEITGNHRLGDIPADLTFTGVGVASLSGTAAVTRLILNAATSHITIGSDWTGNVRHIDLRVGGATTSATVNAWINPDNNTVLQAAASQNLPAGTLARFGSESRRFIGGTEGDNRSFVNPEGIPVYQIVIANNVGRVSRIEN